MKNRNHQLDLSPIGMKFKILKTSADTNGRSVDIEWEIMPDCDIQDLLMHAHPHQVETYKVLEGELEFFVDDRWIKVKKDETITLDKGTAHTFRNTTDTVARVYNSHQPALAIDDYFVRLSYFVNKLTDNGKKEIKKGWKTAIYLSCLMQQFKKEIVPEKIPPVVVNFLSLIGKMLGIRVNEPAFTA